MLLGKFYYCLNFISIHYVISLWIILYYYFYHIWYILGTLIKGPTANTPTPNKSQQTLPHTGQPPILYKGCTRCTTLPPNLDQNQKSQIKITTTIKSPILTIIKLPFTEINKKGQTQNRLVSLWIIKITLLQQLRLPQNKQYFFKPKIQSHWATVRNSQDPKSTICQKIS